MNRTDRLVAVVMLLQSRRVITAAQLAEHFELAERTVYRDLAALGEAGVPIVGEPGVGYSLMRGYHLPPVMFSPQEAFALVTGGLLAERMTDASGRDAIRSALGKVGAVLPTGLQWRVDRLQKAMSVCGRTAGGGPVPLSGVQMAIAEGRVLRLHYRGAARDGATRRVVEPLGLVFYLDHWHLIAWCRLRDAVRDFRVDRVLECETLTEPVPPRRGFDLADYLAKAALPDSDETAVLDIPASLLESLRSHWGSVVLDVCSTGKEVRVKLACCGLDSLARWVLAFSSQIRIIEPDELRERVIAIAEEAAQHHAQEKSGSRKHS